jgi:hypothetical protein
VPNPTAPGKRMEQELVAPTITYAYAKLPAQNVERARAFDAEKLGLIPFGEHAAHVRLPNPMWDQI